MSTEMRKIREDQAKDIKEIAGATRIKESYLKSIENELYDKLPQEVYARGYIKGYAKYLGVPVETALEPYEKYLALKFAPKEKKTGNYLLNYPETEIPEAEKETQKPMDHPWLFSEISAPLASDNLNAAGDGRAWYYKPRYIWKGMLLVVVLCALFIALIISGGPRKEEAKQAVASNAQSMTAVADVSAPRQEQINPEANKPVAPVSPVTDSVKVPAAGAVAAGNSDNKTVQRRKHVLVFSAVEKTWLQLLIDGRDKVEVMMEPGEILTYDASSSISGIVGNGGGVNIKFNGKPLPEGKRGEVIYLNLPEKTPRNIKPSADAPSLNPERHI
jgi:cytoskeleton protein RodZ